MISRVVGLVGCVQGRHERDAARAVPDGDQYVSRCAHCGVPMRRLAKRKWVVERRR
ncbi:MULTISPECIES: hypothetical protein [unclassified Sphingomonas]|jgi:hypothetical protein|uniref:hypothetical protein n=1 Tax=unclassified Sphingomonas TaxID=196159 RepID=UPI000AFF7732|nr:MULTISPECIES: hypothetical protein [unclassified Sphingomonas]MCH4891842.1 hypothetical protein [Sphingomonas sp. SFZ2018-12]